MGKRQRIPPKDKGTPVEKDDMSFEKNVGTEKAKHVVTIDHSLSFEIWFHKHYWDRAHEGDDNGKREGIEPDTIRDLISRALSHLVYYSCRVKTFSFLNINTLSQVLVVVRDCYSQDKILNVPINVFFIAPNKYEITVMTAMREDGFYIRAGQYVLDFDSENSSTLKRFEKPNFVDVSNYEE